MEQDARLRLGEERRLIFQNIATSVPMDQVKVAFLRSEVGVLSDLKFVSQKIREYRFRRQLPPVACDTILEIQWNKLALLETLEFLGPNYLSSPLILPNIVIQSIDSPGMAREAAQRVKAVN